MKTKVTRTRLTWEKDGLSISESHNTQSYRRFNALYLAPQAPSSVDSRDTILSKPTTNRVFTITNDKAQMPNQTQSSNVKDMGK